MATVGALRSEVTVALAAVLGLPAASTPAPTPTATPTAPSESGVTTSE